MPHCFLNAHSTIRGLLSETPSEIPVKIYSWNVSLVKINSDIIQGISDEICCRIIWHDLCHKDWKWYRILALSVMRVQWGDHDSFQTVKFVCKVSHDFYSLNTVNCIYINYSWNELRTKNKSIANTDPIREPFPLRYRKHSDPTFGLWIEAMFKKIMK